jgi:quinol monooxygenase YgiN
MVGMMGGMAGGSLLWGQVASHSSIHDALIIAGLGLAVATLILLPLRVGGFEKHDLTPSLPWPSPLSETDVEHDSGPVLVTLAYRVKPDQRGEFRHLMKKLRQSRRRDGAYYWQLFRDTANPDWHLETFLVESWIEHLRQHERVTVADRRLQDRVQDCLIERAEPMVSHWIAETG